MALGHCVAPLQHSPLARRSAHGARRNGVRRSNLRVMAIGTVFSLSQVKRAQALTRQELKETEQTVLDVLSGARGRGKEGLSQLQVQLLNTAVKTLEANGGVPAPVQQAVLDGKWRLLYTSRPGSASPIQRTFTGVDAFSVFQEVDVATADNPRVTNVVDFGPLIGYLRVEAEASTDAKPRLGFRPRRGAGIPLFGKSFAYPPARRNMRIDFGFDVAAFTFRFLPFKVPYPVPFKLLGDETKGWIDITYMNLDGTLRISRGNKGTLFILTKPNSTKEQLAAAIRDGDEPEVMRLVEQLSAANPTASPAASPLASGTWKLVWSKQADNANPLQKLGSGRGGSGSGGGGGGGPSSYQIIDGEAGTLTNVLELTAGVQVKATAACSVETPTRTQVAISEAGVYLGPSSSVRVPLPTPGPDKPGYIDWLYLDDTLRITRGNKGSLFIHRRQQ